MPKALGGFGDCFRNPHNKGTKMLELFIWKLTIISLVLGVVALLNGMILTALALDALGMLGVYYIFCSEYYGGKL